MKKPNLASRAKSLFLLQNTGAPPRESNTAPTDYESAALTKHELGGHGITDIAFDR